MIKNFDEIKKQLSDLAEVINGYKSEAVQLKIIEALLSGVSSETLIVPREEVSDGNLHKSKAKKKKSILNEGGSDGAKSGKVGGKKTPKKSVVQLVGQGFFKERRTVPQVQEHLKTKLAANFAVSSLQNALNSLLHDDTIKREKNKEDQYEYWT